MEVTTEGLREERRERRRRDLGRMKAKARRVYHFNTGNAEKLANHLAVCSCWMCGNPRRYFGERTVQERRHDD